MSIFLQKINRSMAASMIQGGEDPNTSEQRENVLLEDPSL